MRKDQLFSFGVPSLTLPLLSHGKFEAMEGLRGWWSYSTPEIKSRACARLQGKVSVTGKQTQRAAFRAWHWSRTTAARGKKKHHREDLLKLPTAAAILALLQQIGVRVLKEKLSGEIHNLFLTSAAQLTHDSKAFSGIPNPSRQQGAGRDPTHIYTAG